MDTMIDFGFEPVVTRTRPQANIVVATNVPQVVETVTVTPRPSQAAGFVLRPDSDWGWQDLRDYVVREIERRGGAVVRNPKTEASIFKSFMTRHPDKAVAIAKAAFEVHDGMWRNAPISVNRFCKASDEYFASVIATNL